jgi:predicted PurR-regulated permease PerM
MTERTSSEQGESLPVRLLELRVGWHTWVALGITLIVSLILFGALRQLVRPLAILFLGLAVAASLEPLVDRLARSMPRLLAVIVVYSVVVLILVGLGLLVVPPLVNQVQDLRAGLSDLMPGLEQRFGTIRLSDLMPIISNAASAVGSMGSQILMVPETASNLVFSLVLVFFLALYAQISAPALHEFVLSLVPKEEREGIDQVLGTVVADVGGYLRGVSITGLFVGVFAYIGLSIIGAPYPIVLSVLAATLELIPVIGTAVSTALITGVAFTVSLSTGLITFAYMVALQLVEGNILFPNIISRQTDTSPLLSIFAFSAGLSVGGIIGALIGVPVAVALRVIMVEAIAPAIRRWTHANTGEEKTEAASS